MLADHHAQRIANLMVSMYTGPAFRAIYLWAKFKDIKIAKEQPKEPGKETDLPIEEDQNDHLKSSSKLKRIGNDHTVNVQGSIESNINSTR